MAELDLNGVFVPGLLAWAALAYLGRSLIAWMMDLTGAWRFIWHRPLFDMSLFVILWGGVSDLMFNIGFPGIGAS